MLINVITVHVMKMTIMKIIDVVLMAYCCMSTMRTVLVSMVRVLLLAAGGHLDFPFFLCRGRDHIMQSSALESLRPNKRHNLAKLGVDIAIGRRKRSLTTTMGGADRRG
jgi:hypothetical protein